eukprot:CAMPEP_0197053114 /NCGR_PEP_ID=MMETSP1384-20130603/27455_1 /TAXON_ID=29189 /ORGANISM="Ammonia sp." /LENGTH=542 /DNA_ID=CAMNT_0042485961 /DNA_START=546 /DNA_END=2171 /DNA_ORIENTATION=+
MECAAPNNTNHIYTSNRWDNVAWIAPPTPEHNSVESVEPQQPLKQPADDEMVKALPSEPPRKSPYFAIAVWKQEMLVYGYIKSRQGLFVPVDVVELIAKYSHDKYQFALNSNQVYKLGVYGSGECGERIAHRHDDLYSLRNLNDKLAALYTRVNDVHIYCGSYKYYVHHKQQDVVYAAGLNTNGCLGLGHLDPVNEFKQIQIELDDDDAIRLLSNGVGSDHTFLVTRNGKMWVWGNNASSQFGVRGNHLFNTVPRNYAALDSIFQSLRITKIECGANHTLFLCANGKCLSCGNNKKGQCGLPALAVYYKPQVIAAITEEIYDIAVGSEHNLCLSTSKRLWVFGTNNKGCLGLGNVSMDDEQEEPDESYNFNHSQADDAQTLFVEPMLHPFFVDVSVRLIRCGANHSMCITYSKQCYLWGDNSSNQIFTDTRASIGFYMDQYSEPQLYKYQALNGWCGANHSVVLCSDNCLVSVGDNKFELCSESLSFLKENEIIVNVVAGSENTLLVSNKHHYERVPLKLCAQCNKQKNRKLGAIDEDDGNW